MTQTLWPNNVLTQFLTNHGYFRSCIYKGKKAPNPLCSCPEKAEHTAQHLLTEFSQFSKKDQLCFEIFSFPNNAAPHKKDRIIQTNQKHLPHATGTIEK